MKVQRCWTETLTATNYVSVCDLDSSTEYNSEKVKSTVESESTAAHLLAQMEVKGQEDDTRQTLNTSFYKRNGTISFSWLCLWEEKHTEI